MLCSPRARLDLTGPALIDGEEEQWRGACCLAGVSAALAGVAAVALTASQGLAAARIAVITPYLAQPGTQFYVEAFQEQAKANGWDVNVIDTKGDVAAAISRIEDATNQKVDAIVINVDPAQVAAGLETARKRRRPGVRHGRRRQSAPGHQRHQQRLRDGRRYRRLCRRTGSTARARS